MKKQDQGDKPLLDWQNRAPNTIRLRQAFADYIIDTKSQGDETESFEDWAKRNHPDKKILNQ